MTADPVSPDRRKVLEALLERRASREEACMALNMSWQKLCLYAERNRIDLIRLAKYTTVRGAARLGAIRIMFAQGHTAAQIARHFGLSRERIRQLDGKYKLSSITRTKRPAPSSLTPAQVIQLRQLVDGGATLARMKKEFKVGEHRLNAWFKLHGITRATKVRVTDAQLLARMEEIKQMLVDGVAFSSMAVSLGVNLMRFRQWLLKHLPDAPRTTPYAGPPIKYLPKAQLLHWIRTQVVQGRSTRDIAAETGMTQIYIASLIRKNGLRENNTHAPFSA